MPNQPKPSDLAIPGGWDAVTPAWLTAMLAASFPGVEVAAIELVLRDDGTNRRARFALEYAAGSGPATVFLKASDPAHAKLNHRTGGLFNEARLFTSGAAIPCEHPAVYGSIIDEPGLDFVIAMEDVVARGADPRDATRPLTVEQAASGVRGLAALHGAYWGDRLVAATELAWVDRFVAWAGVMGKGIDIGIELAGDRLPAEVRALTGDQLEADHWARYIGTVDTGPATLLHGDAHVGNTYVLPGDELGFLDWQVLRRGDHVLDLGYFLQGALTIEDRRTHERELVEEYRDALALPADEQPGADAVWLRYRASASHGLALWLATAASPWQRREVSLALSERYAAAFVDLDSAAAIATLVAG